MPFYNHGKHATTYDGWKERFIVLLWSTHPFDEEVFSRREGMAILSGKILWTGRDGDFYGGKCFLAGKGWYFTAGKN